MGQIVGEYPSGCLKYILCKHMVTVGRMLPVLFGQQFREKLPVLLITIQLSQTAPPFVVARFVDAHEPTQENNRVFPS